MNFIVIIQDYLGGAAVEKFMHTLITCASTQVRVISISTNGRFKRESSVGLQCTRRARYKNEQLSVSKLKSLSSK